MARVLVGTADGCRLFSGKESTWELPGRAVGPFVPDEGGGCYAIVAEREVWWRSPEGSWSSVAVAPIKVQSISRQGRTLLVGGTEEASILSVDPRGAMTALRGFDTIPGRSEWFAGGPPLGVRSLAAMGDERTLLAAVHVGGIPRSTDHGKTWTPTIPVMFDAHEVRAHPVRPEFAVAAAAVGLCISRDGGEHWEVRDEGLEGMTSLAVGVLEAEILFSVQEGPFATRSQIWCCPVDGGELQPVRGLPAWLEGKVDTAQIATGHGDAAVCDGGGNLWLSRQPGADWQCIAQGVGYANGLLIV